MFNSKFFISVFLFTTFLIITSFIKNQSRILEKKISSLNIKVISKEKDLSETQLDFYYLSSPQEIEKIFIKKNLNDFQPIKYSKIFNKIDDYINIEKKLSNLVNIDEKKIKKK